MSTTTKLPKSVIAALKNVSRRLSLEGFNCGNDIVITGSISPEGNKREFTRTELVKDSMRLYLSQDTKGIIDFLIGYGEGENKLEGNEWIETL